MLPHVETPTSEVYPKLSRASHPYGRVCEGGGGGGEGLVGGGGGRSVVGVLLVPNRQALG